MDDTMNTPVERIANEFEQALQAFQRDILQWAVDFVTEFEREVLPAVQHFYDTVYQSYLTAGAPYGDTPEGAGRWFREQVFGPSMTKQDAHRFLTTGNPWQVG